MAAPATALPPPVSPRRIAWLILKDPEGSRPYLNELFRQSPEIASSAAVARQFVRMFRDGDASAWASVAYIGCAKPRSRALLDIFAAMNPPCWPR